MAAMHVSSASSRWAPPSCTSRSRPRRCATRSYSSGGARMTRQLDDHLFQAAANTFESFAFVCGTRASQPVPPIARLEASVRFDGPVAGRLVLRTADPVLAAVTENILGAIEPANPEYQEDALGELANIICGSALTALQQD